MELDVPVGEVVTLLLRHGLDAYRNWQIEFKSPSADRENDFAGKPVMNVNSRFLGKSEGFFGDENYPMRHRIHAAHLPRTGRNHSRKHAAYLPRTGSAVETLIITRDDLRYGSGKIARPRASCWLFELEREKEF